MREAERLRGLGERLNHAAFTLASGGSAGEVQGEVASVLAALAAAEGGQHRRAMAMLAEEERARYEEQEAEVGEGTSERGVHSADEGAQAALCARPQLPELNGVGTDAAVA